jgi:tRNA A37 threonylcarbamoyltransferase TsaD
VARKLGLYALNRNDNLSGGALIEEYAKMGNNEKFEGFKNKMKDFSGKNKDCNFDYGYLTTDVFNLIHKFEKKQDLDNQTISDICASFQSAMSLQLETRLERAIIYYNTVLKKKLENTPTDKNIDIVSYYVNIYSF